MPDNIPVGYAQATFGFTHEASPRPMAITLGLQLPLGASDQIEVANAVQARYERTVLEDQDNSLTLTGVDLFIGDGDNPSGSISSTRPAKAGGRPMQAAPLNTAVLVTKFTGKLGRRGRGRVSVPASCSRDEVSEVALLSDTIRTSLQGSWDDFYTALTTEGLPGETGADLTFLPVLFHQTAPFTPDPIARFRVEQKVATRPGRIR